MDLIKISIIVPIYNAEDFLEDCLHSIQNQTFSDYEVWLIDDGSSDSSGMICDQFQKRNPQFHVIHQKNAGVSTARNVGIEHAKGEWICFIDSDDTIELNYLKNLYQSITNNKKDVLIVQGYKTILPDNKIQIKTFPSKLYWEKDIAYTFKDLNINRSGFPFAKLYNTQIIKENHIRFIKEISYAEDVMFMLTYLCYINGIQTISGTGYNYYIRNNVQSLSQRIFSFESEYLCYKTYLSKLHFLSKRFSIPNEFLNKAFGVVSEYLIRRSIGSLYLPRTRKKQTERISILKSITADETKLVNKYYTECAWFHKVTVFLITKHYYYLCDLFNNIIAIARTFLSKKYK